jgi:uncharacterized membrane protein
MRNLIELSAQAIEGFAILMIVIAMAHGTIQNLFHLQSKVENAYEQYKARIGKGLLLGLEFLVAANIIRTVALEPSVHNVAVLGF